MVRGVVWDEKWSDIVARLAPADRLAVYDAFNAYAAGRDPGPVEGVAAGVWMTILDAIERSGGKRTFRTRRCAATTTGRDEAESERREVEAAKTDDEVEAAITPTDNGDADANNAEGGISGIRWHKWHKVAQDGISGTSDTALTRVHTRAGNESNLADRSNHTLTARARDGDDAFYEELTRSRFWQEQAAMLLRVPLAELQNRLTAFRDECRVKGMKHRDLTDYKRHFVDFTRIQIEKRTRYGGREERQRREAEKRQASALDAVLRLIQEG